MLNRSPGSPLPPRISDTADDVHDPGGGGIGSASGAFGITRRTSTPPSSPAFSDGPISRDGAGTNGSEDAAAEPPLFATVAQFCTLGVAEETVPPALAGAAPGGDGGGGGDDSQTGAAAGGGGVVSPAMLPSLFPKQEGECTLSEGVRMVLSSVGQEGGVAAPGGGASPGVFSLHSVTSEDVIVKASLSHISLIPSTPYLVFADTGGVMRMTCCTTVQYRRSISALRGFGVSFSLF